MHKGDWSKIEVNSKDKNWKIGKQWSLYIKMIRIQYITGFNRADNTINAYKNVLKYS